MNQTGVFLKKGKEIIFANRHLWIFSGAIESFPKDFENGSIYPVYNFKNELMGHGYFHKGLSLCGRIISFGPIDPILAIKEHLDCAIYLRNSLFDTKKTNAYRLVNGEADLLPGLIIDQYNDHLVIQSFTLGMDKLKETIIAYLVKKGLYKGIHEKSSSPSRKEEKLKDIIQTHYGEDVEEFSVLENGFHFYVNWKKGQKTGFFLDQREMRKRVQELSYNKKILNCFSYTGGFSVYALAGKAKQVDSIDISGPAVQTAKRNVEINNLQNKENKFLEADVFDFLTKDPLQYDLVILDPPAFAKKKDDIKQASKGYRQINYLALSKMPKNSLLLTCSCSYHIDENLFQMIIFQAAKDAGREVKIISKHILGMDHPINLFHPESNYLKSLLLYIY